MFLETICIDKGVVLNVEGHKQRMAETALHFGFTAPKLRDLVASMSEDLLMERVKCSITYRERITKMTFTAYRPKVVRTLKVVEAEGIDYSYKLADRSNLETLLGQRGGYDELLLTQNGFITDTTYSNVVFEREGAYFTPTTYLLNGTKRRQLLQQGVIKEVPITIRDLHLYEKVYLINAMLDLSDGVALSTSHIY